LRLQCLMTNIQRLRLALIVDRVQTELLGQLL